MTPRRDFITIFSTFLKWENGRDYGWIRDAKLHRSMENYLLSSNSSSADECVIYWHQLWQQQVNSLAKTHLIAYLEELRYNAAKYVWNRYTPINYSVTLQDYFESNERKIESILKNFDYTKGFSLGAYAFPFFKSATIAYVREHINKSAFHSDWSLLRRIKAEGLIKVLNAYGITLEKIEHYLSAWEYFNHRYAPSKPTGNKSFPPPDDKTWQAITQDYNSNKQPEAPKCEVQEIQQLLKTCVQAIRQYSIVDNTISTEE